MQLTADDETPKKVLSGISLKLFRMRQRAFIILLANKLKKYADDFNKDGYTYTFTEKFQTLEQAEQQKKEVEEFLYQEETFYRKDADRNLNAFFNDRWIQNVNNKVHNLALKSKEWAFKKALMGTDVNGFLLRIGIVIDLKTAKAED